MKRVCNSMGHVCSFFFGFEVIKQLKLAFCKGPRVVFDSKMGMTPRTRSSK